MRDIKLNDGVLTFRVNEDDSRIARYNPADPTISTRIRDRFSSLEAIENEYFKALDTLKSADTEKMTDAELNAELNNLGDAQERVDQKMRAEIDYIFNGDVAAAMFGGTSPFAIVEGKYFWVVVFNTLCEQHKAAMTRKADKYTSKYTNHQKPRKKRRR